VSEEPPFPVFDVSTWEITAEETSGAEAKFWLEEPDTRDRWLFKSVTIKEGHVHGEDWAEKASAHLANLLGTPCAHVEMAVRGESHGSISANLRSDPYQMQPGQVLLETCNVPGYVHHSKGKFHPGHSLENIHTALAGVSAPPGCELPFNAMAFDVFAGYVLLDAWIANQDRHDNNWSVLIPGTAATGPPHLSGSYDHASSLGFNEPDSARVSLLAEPGGLERWCAKGKAKRFEYDRSKGAPTLVDVAARALNLASEEARAYWPQQLSLVDDEDVRRVLSRVPRMSEAARTFALRVLEVNRRRVLDACT
jgi:hypothetical protein